MWQFLVFPAAFLWTRLNNVDYTTKLLLKIIESNNLESVWDSTAASSGWTFHLGRVTSHAITCSIFPPFWFLMFLMIFRLRERSFCEICELSIFIYIWVCIDFKNAMVQLHLGNKPMAKRQLNTSQEFTWRNMTEVTLSYSISCSFLNIFGNIYFTEF